LTPVSSGDFRDEGVGAQQAEFAADPGGAVAVLFGVGGLGKEDSAEIAIAEAVDDELVVVDS
jgi:hypothetical protein